MKALLGVLAVLILGAVLFVGQATGTRNKLVTEREAIDNQFSQVDVALQRRSDLIPNLVNTVKGFATQEKEVFTNIANARAALAGARTPAEKIQANGQLDSALSRLLVITENYPQLRSSDQFLRLQDELSGTENRIAVERRKYNEQVQRYNTDVSLFPNNIAASLFGFQKDKPYFNADASSRTVPKVQF